MTMAWRGSDSFLPSLSSFLLLSSSMVAVRQGRKPQAGDRRFVLGWRCFIGMKLGFQGAAVTLCGNDHWGARGGAWHALRDRRSRVSACGCGLTGVAAVKPSRGFPRPPLSRSGGGHGVRHGRGREGVGKGRGKSDQRSGPRWSVVAVEAVG